jgi:hypothetical protein
MSSVDDQAARTHVIYSIEEVRGITGIVECKIESHGICGLAIKRGSTTLGQIFECIARVPVYLFPVMSKVSNLSYLWIRMCSRGYNCLDQTGARVVFGALFRIVTRLRSRPLSVSEQGPDCEVCGRSSVGWIHGCRGLLECYWLSFLMRARRLHREEQSHAWSPWGPGPLSLMSTMRFATGSGLPRVPSVCFKLNSPLRFS